MTPKIICAQYPTSLDSLGIPEIIDLHYDLKHLRLALKFENHASPAMLTIDSPIGFKMLNETDLIDYWAQENRPNGWLWTINKGGWIDQEDSRNTGFKVRRVNAIEYLILGVEDCVAVISPNIPKLDLSSDAN